MLILGVFMAGSNFYYDKCKVCGENNPIFYAYPLLVCNPFGFDLTLDKQDAFEDTIFGEKSFTLFLSDKKVGVFVKTFVDDDCQSLIGERVYFTFDGVKKSEG